MKKNIRLILVLLAIGVTLIFIGQQVVRAAPPPPIDVNGNPKTGAGPYSLGGCITGTVKDLKPGYKINVAVLEGWNSYRTEGLPPMPLYYWSLPGGTEDIFSCVAVIKIMENDQLLQEFPLYKKDKDSQAFPFTKGSAEVCLETPLNVKEGYIYFYDQFRWFYDKKINGDNYPNWVKVGGPFPGGTRACVPVTYSGVYGYYAPEPEKDLNDPAMFQTTVIYKREGSVLVPDYVTTIAKNGPIALGGCVTGNVADLPENKGYEMTASILTSLEDQEKLPPDVGKLYNCIVDLKLNQNGNLIDELPGADGNVTLCFAVPPNQKGTIYFFDKYFNDKAVWEPVSDPYKSGIACGPVMKSGYYAMVDTVKK